MVEVEYKPNDSKQPHIKLIKNSRGYNWEIKNLSVDVEEMDKINKQMLERYGDLE